MGPFVDACLAPETDADRLSAAVMQQRIGAVEERSFAEDDVVGHRHLEPVAVGGNPRDRRGDSGHRATPRLTTTAGLPATTAPVGTERVTTAPDATTAPAPMVTP